MAKFHYKESPTQKQRDAFKKYLSEDEELILVTGFSGAYLRNKFLVYLLFPGVIYFGFAFGIGWVLNLGIIWALVLGFMSAAGYTVLKTMHTFHSNRYLLTTRRVIIKHGLFSVKLTATLFDKITNIEVDQSIIDRLLLHHGSIIINTAGMNKGEIALRFIDYPMEFKNLLERLINREREQFGLRGQTLTEVEGEIIS